MNAPPETDAKTLRWGVYWLLIALATGAIVGRILAVNSVDKIALESFLHGKREKWQLQRPFLSANDRSRWLTIRALVEQGTYEIDKLHDEPNWDSIDVVMHADRQGKMHRYSSKPPLLPTLLAGEYWLIYHLTGATLQTHPYAVGRFMLVTFNVLPLLVYFFLLGKLADRFGGADWGRLFMMAGATFGTMLTTFAVVLNNHLPAAVSAVIAFYAAVRIWCDGERRWRYFIVAGLFAAFTAANELPALSFLAALGLALLWKAPKQTLLLGAPAVLLVAAAFFGTNKIAHDSWRPPYMHRGEGDNWYDYEYVDSHNRRRESYWRTANKIGLDVGEPSRAAYAFHATLGHHGIFSLTPMWLLSVAGLWFFWRSGRSDMRAVAFLIASLSAICLAFYLMRPLEDRNYGGMSSGFRWMFWFAPLWLVALLPCADRMGRRGWTKAVALLLLAASAMSAAYPTWNPWTYPWIQDWLQSMGWLDVT